MDGAHPIAVIDTNVMLSLATCIDAANHYTKIFEVDPSEGAQADTEESTFIRMRIREATLLAQYLHETGATTFSLHEFERMVREKVELNFEKIDPHFALVWLDYTKPTLLNRWLLTTPIELNEPTGSDADTLLVETAKEWDVPLISYEGLSTAGIDPDRKGMRRKAKQAGVRLVTPREFYWQDEQHELLLSALFVTRFKSHAPDYIAKKPHPEVMLNTFNHLEAYYRHVLYGDTLGHREALAVRL